MISNKMISKNDGAAIEISILHKKSPIFLPDFFILQIAKITISQLPIFARQTDYFRNRSSQNTYLIVDATR